MRVRRTLTSVLGAAICLLVTAGAAAGADRIYWTDFGSPQRIGVAELSGPTAGAGATLNTGAAPLNLPQGIAVDSAANRVIWVNGGLGGGPISYAALDGSGAGILAESAVRNGLAIDPETRWIYWGEVSGEIGRLPLDGSAPPSALPTPGATRVQPVAMAIDPAARRLYWADAGAEAISYAALDGSGGGTLPLPAGTVESPISVAIDPIGGRLYWANYFAGTIFSSDLAGGAVAQLATPGTAVSEPRGLAIDPVSRRIYWANAGGSLAVTALDGSGGSALGLGPGGPDVVGGLAIQLPPRTEWTVGLGGPARVGVPLSCEGGAWDPDQPGANFYRAPTAIGRAWTRDGAPLADADRASLTPRGAGVYGCAITAANAAGSVTVASDPVAIIALGGLRHRPRKGIARLAVRIPAAGRLRLSGKGVAGRSLRVRRAGRRLLTVRAKGVKRRALRRRGKVKLRVRVRFRPDAGRGGGLERPVVLRLRRGR